MTQRTRTKANTEKLERLDSIFEEYAEMELEVTKIKDSAKRTGDKDLWDLFHLARSESSRLLKKYNKARFGNVNSENLDE
tara:strand:+ start:278 stop:517 length:240 start_codon:yes stop_codon:yes gene_type:complete